jgi:hypothetical protein
MDKHGDEDPDEGNSRDSEIEQECHVCAMRNIFSGFRNLQ